MIERTKINVGCAFSCWMSLSAALVLEVPSDSITLLGILVLFAREVVYRFQAVSSRDVLAVGVPINRSKYELGREQ
jgi:hypothetical protein